MQCQLRCVQQQPGFHQKVHMDSSSNKRTKVENEWQLKNIQAPTFVDHSKQSKQYENSKSSWENYKKVNTIVSTNVEGKDKKQSTVNRK